MRLRAFLLVLGLLAPAVSRAQTGFSIVASPGASPGTAAAPNTTWADTPYENAPPTYPDDDDWSLSAGAPFAVYLVPDEGSTFGAIDATLTWDPEVMTLTGVSKAGGLFDGAGGAFFSITPADGQLRINASRLDGQNLTAGPADHVARLAFELVVPGHSEVAISDLDVRRYDGVGGQSALTASATAGAVRAYLGDIATMDDAATGDGLVDFEDLTVFADAYYAGTEAVGYSLDRYKLKLDMGPTADGSVFTAPQADQKVEFEDLVVFALSYARSQQGVYLRAPASEPTVSAQVALWLGEPVRDGEDRLVPLRVADVADLRAFAFQLAIAPSFELIAVETSGGLGEGQDLFLVNRAVGAVAYVDGAALGEASLAGSGTVLTVRLRPRAGTASSDERTPLATLVEARLRTSGNVPIPSRRGPPDDATTEAAMRSGLRLPHPNPVRGTADVPFDLAEPGPVTIQILDALGRSVTTLVNASLQAGPHVARWDTAGVPAGTYLLRFEAGLAHQVRSLTVLP